MPQELSRTTARKRIYLTDVTGEETGPFVDVPVITKIAFVDQNDRYQEIQLTVDNSAGAGRRVRVDNVYQFGAGATGESLAVERIVTWAIFDASDRGQETQITMDNETGKDEIPPHFATHIKTHVVRYENPDDPSVWIESELIDQFSVIDGNERGQETVYFLNNPAEDEDAQADPSDPEISDTDNGVDPPFRTDPFQNIIQYSNKKIVVRFFVQNSNFFTFASGGASPPPRDRDAFFITDSSTTSWTTNLVYGGSTVPPADISVSFSGGGSSTQTKPPDQYAYEKNAGWLDFGVHFRPATLNSAGLPDGSTAEMDVLLWPVDGPWSEDFGVHSELQTLHDFSDAIAPNPPPDYIYLVAHASIVQTRTFDFSTVTATYLGNPYEYDSLFSVGTQDIFVVLKPTDTA